MLLQSAVFQFSLNSFVPFAPCVFQQLCLQKSLKNWEQYKFNHTVAENVNEQEGRELKRFKFTFSTESR